MSSSVVGLVIIINGFGLCIRQWVSTSLCTGGIVSTIQLLRSRWSMHGVLAGALGNSCVLLVLLIVLYYSRGGE